MSLSNFAENEIADWLGGNGAPSTVSNVYVKLHVDDPGEDCTSNPATETTRVEATFGSASGGSVTNDAEVLWTDVAASETYSHFSIWDHPTAGNPLGSGALTAPKAVTAGEDARFDVGALTVTVT